MRTVKLTTSDVEQTIQVAGPVTRLTGTDTKTGERVKFKLTDAGHAGAVIAIVSRDGSHTMMLLDHQVIAAEPAEYMDDEEF